MHACVRISGDLFSCVTFMSGLLDLVEKFSGEKNSLYVGESLVYNSYTTSAIISQSHFFFYKKKSIIKIFFKKSS